MGRAIPYALKPTQVLRSTAFTMNLLTIVAWLLTAQAFLTGTPIENLTRPGSGSGSGGGFSLADIPKPGPGTTEDCLFLDVYTPKSIYEAPKKNPKKGGGRCISFPITLLANE
jgi:hypothetical protein